tara:strand:+ start:675 stop:1061 length:387 start_codon:yes stop_codon:yes gene_type:complete
MKIYGFGVDLVNIDRIKKTIKRNKNFKKRVFSKQEILNCKKKKNIFSCYAKKYAAKEAFSKALGTGISKGLSFNEIEILNNKEGKPTIKLKKNTYLVAKKIIKKSAFKCFVTISDENPFALAAVIISI